jgi:hypothetical protein
MFEELTKKQLQTLAEENDLPVSGNKDDIIERLVEAGVEEPQAEPEDYEPDDDQEGTDRELDEGHNEEVGFGDPAPLVREQVSSPAPVDDLHVDNQPAKGVITTETLKPEEREEENTPEEKGYAVDETGRRLVKMTKPAVRHGIGGGRAFTKTHPFLLLDAEEAESLVNSSGFRYASMEEARDYYG